ncbi:MAG: hypothetical protein CW691_05170 [Candidatus Bathyarchaeum sp.]|nr:MAG: hypothetical protein CW691_05170 [Candidatus Bathyarchaeum sp.]
MKSKSMLLLAVFVAFFVFQLFLFAKSFPAEYNLYLRYVERLETTDPFWTNFWFSSELIGEVGLAIRFVGSSLALAFGYVLVRKKQTNLSLLRKAVLCEGIYYVSNVPFIISLFARPNTSLVNIEAGLSYLLQMLFVSVPFFFLYFELKKKPQNNSKAYKWATVAIVGFALGLWIKHFFMNLYALPINLADSLLFTGFLNSTLTPLLGTTFLTIALLPIIKEKSLNYNSRLCGVGFLFIGLYFVIYLLISLVNQSYANFLVLTELWAISFIVPGVGFAIKNN